MALTSEAILNSWTVANREGQPPHIMILDCRASKQLDVEAIARLIIHLSMNEIGPTAHWALIWSLVNQIRLKIGQKGPNID